MPLAKMGSMKPEKLEVKFSAWVEKQGEHCTVLNSLPELKQDCSPHLPAAHMQPTNPPCNLSPNEPEIPPPQNICKTSHSFKTL